MKLKTAKAIAYQLDMEGYKSELREDYSGRFMYGAETPGIVTDADSLTVGSVIGELYANEEIDEKPALKTDNMGLSTIYY